MIIRRFLQTDSKEVSDLIIKTLREVNIKDYPKEYIENEVQRLQPNKILKRAEWTHFYVACDENKLVGCGAIGPYWDKWMKAVYLPSSFYPIIRVKESEER